jgi:outer membrane protein TolC
MVLLLSGCAAVGPDYQKPEVEVPDKWQAPLIEGVTEGQSGIQTWWKLFDDPVLDQLITRTQSDSLNIKMAAARVQAAAYRAAASRGAELPQVEAGAQAKRGQISDESSIGIAVSRFYQFPVENNFEVGLGAGWIIDVFGQVRRSIEASDASYQASIENYRDVLVILLSRVAQTYTQVRALAQRIEYAETNAISQGDTLTLTRNRYNSGLPSSRCLRQVVR